MKWLLRLLVIGASLLPAAEAAGQVRPVTPPAGRQAPARDTIPRVPRDTAAAPGDTIREPIRWVEEDSVARALLQRPGYTVTRYQGPILTFDAVTRAIDLLRGIGDTARVAVQREDRLVVSDSAISYSEVTGRAVAEGRTIFREGQTELTGLGGEYNLAERSVTIRGGRTVVQTQENWLVTAELLKAVQTDSANAQNYFGRRGTLTSCTDTTHGGPHYHFAFKEIKRTAGNTLVARPAVLYIADIPVMWLPFVFQDMREGRRSGMLTPTFGITDLVRNSPSYRRRFENLGYYWAINDYMDADASLDWLSGTGRGTNEIGGFTRYNAEWRYRWIDRYVTGTLGSTYTRQGDGRSDLAASWTHGQEFTRHRRLQANVNWVQNTSVQRETNIHPSAVLATIASSINLSDRFGPASVSLGGNRKQYPGRREVEQGFPTLNVTTGTLSLRPWLNWTPRFSFDERRRTDITQPPQPGLGILFREVDGRIVADTIRQNARTTRASFDTPIEIFGYSLRNSFSFSDEEIDFPQQIPLLSADPLQPAEVRVFAQTYRSTLDWTPSFSLRSFAQGTWNLVPSLSFANVDHKPFMIRTQLSGGRWVQQTKRPTIGVGVSPTFYALFPGFAGFSRFRHTVEPRLSYTYAPARRVSDEFLLAENRSPRGYLGALSQNQLSLTLATNIEAKGRAAEDDTTAAAASAAKVKIVSLTFTPLSYDVSRYRSTGVFMRGITNPNFGTRLTSDLLPGVDLSFDYSLFEGDVQADTAVFSPFLTRVSGGFQLNAERNPLILLTRLFGRAVPANRIGTAEMVEPVDDRAAREAAVRPVAGTSARESQAIVPPAGGWSASFTFSTSRQRPPPPGANVATHDPAAACEWLRGNEFNYRTCIDQEKNRVATDAPVTSPFGGSTYYRVDPMTSVNVNTQFALTPRWSAQWGTNYDVVRGEFASQNVGLQRDLHDWRAVFSFIQSPNGSFAFSFVISLKAEPDLKLPYNRASYRRDDRR